MAANMQHSPYHYDEHFALKVPLPLWGVLLYSVWHILFYVLAAFSRSSEIFSWAADDLDVRLIASDFLALPVLVALANRKPGAKEWVYKLWQKGRWLLVGSVGLNLALLLLTQQKHLTDAYGWVLPSLVVDAAALAYLLGSRLVRDVFLDFPGRAGRVVPVSENVAEVVASPTVVQQDIGGVRLSGEYAIFDLVFAFLVLVSLVSFGLDYDAPADFKWVPIAMTSVLAILYLGVKGFLQESVSLDWLDVLLLVFVGYVALSLTWSIDPREGLMFLAKFGLCAAIFIYIKDHATDMTLLWVCVAIALATVAVLAMVYLELVKGDWLAGFVNVNLITEFFLLALPFIGVIALVTRHPLLRILPVMLIGIILYYLLRDNISKIEYLVLPVTALLIVARHFWLKGRHVWVVGFMLLGVASLVAFAYLNWETESGSFKNVGHSVLPRLALYFNTLLMWGDAPLFGHGIGSFNGLYLFYQDRHFAYLGEHAYSLFFKIRVAGAAHNEYLQLGAELGVVGIAIMAAFLGAMIRGFRRIPRHGTLTWAGVIACVMWMTNAMIEFPLQVQATALLATLSAGLVARGIKAELVVRQIQLGRTSSVAILCGALALVPIAGYATYRFDRGHVYYGESAANMQNNPETAYRRARLAYESLPWDPFIRAQLFLAANKWLATVGVGQPLLPSPEEYDHMYMIGRTAGHFQSVLAGRVEYLGNSERYREEVRAREIEELLGLLRKASSRTVEVWLLDAAFALNTNHLARAKAAIAVADSLGPDDTQRQTLDKLKRVLAERLPVERPAPGAVFAPQPLRRLW